MTEREAELRQKLAEIGTKYQKAFHAEVQPIIDELVKIEIQKPPKPIIGPDGKVYSYIGPVSGHRSGQ